jgi:uncharacterized membrane protein YeaQ/YmgE (transglycosylase-associated protein family)
MMAIGVPLIGAFAGWIAAGVMRSCGLTRWSSVGIGILGAMIGSVLFDLLGFPLPWLLVQVVGASAGAAGFLAVTYALHANSFPRRHP